jgi:hypothetical protein
MENAISLRSDPLTTERHMVYAGFWSRVWAALIDTVVQFVVLWPLLFAAKQVRKSDYYLAGTGDQHLGSDAGHGLDVG